MTTLPLINAGYTLLIVGLHLKAQMMRIAEGTISLKKGL